ncbi:MAG: GNAT family N-acetyltransferase [Rickettsiaceae bacterium]|nr:GNAT family N-acetyltransferase [Rickettsiaceae bacterium]
MPSKFNSFVLKGKEIAPFLSDLASLRIFAFHEYPYLYAGDAEYEKDYLSTYAKCEDFVLLVIIDGGMVIGVTTGIPLKYEEDSFKEAFENTEYNTDDIFYIGETILLPEYRNQGLSRLMFNKVEQEALEQGYKILSLATVKRDENDPGCPAGYVSMDFLWQKYGYERRPDIMASLSWREVGQDFKTTHDMVFWLKQI